MKDYFGLPANWSLFTVVEAWRSGTGSAVTLAKGPEGGWVVVYVDGSMVSHRYFINGSNAQDSFRSLVWNRSNQKTKQMIRAERKAAREKRKEAKVAQRLQETNEAYDDNPLFAAF